MRGRTTEQKTILKTNIMAKRAEKRTGLFLQVVGNGRMGMYVENPNDNSEPYTNAEGTTRNYEFYDTIGGMLSKVYCYDKNFGTEAKPKNVEMLVITLINEEGNKESLTMPFNSPYAQSLIKRLENIDINKPIELKTFKIKDKEKSAEKGKDIFNELCLPYQDNATIKTDYVKDGAKKLPDAVITTVKEKGKSVKKYDFTAQKEALRDIVKSVAASLKDIEGKSTYAPVNEVEHDAVLGTDEKEELPF